MICGTLYQDANVAFHLERSIQGKQSIFKPFLINLKKPLQIRIGKNTTPKTLHSSAMIPLNPLPSHAQRAMISKLIRCRALIDLVLSHRMNSWRRTQWMYYPNPASNCRRSFEVWNPLDTISFMNHFWPNLSQNVHSFLSKFTETKFWTWMLGGQGCKMALSSRQALKPTNWKQCIVHMLPGHHQLVGAISLYHSFGDISHTTAPFCQRLHKTKGILWKSTICNVNPQATYALQSEWVAQSYV